MTDKETKPKTPEKPSKPSVLPALMSGLALLLAVAVAGFGWFHWQHNDMVNQQMRRGLADLSQQVFDNKHSAERVQAFSASLKEQVAGVQQDRGDHVWVLREVNFIIRLAHYQLQFNHDSVSALALLQLADEQLKALSDERLNALREALLEQIQALKAVPLVDIDGLSAQIKLLSEHIKNLPQDHAVAGKTQVSETVPSVPDVKQGWRDALKQSLDQLQKIVIIRHHDKSIEPLRNIEQQLVLQQNVKLLLLQAKWGVLNRDAKQYRDSLAQAKAFVIKHYDSENSEVKAYLETLSTLENTEITPTLPDLSGLMNKTHETQSQLSKQAASPEPEERPSDLEDHT